MQKCLRCARPNKLGFLLLAQKTHLFVRLRREKSTPVGALQEWDKKKKKLEELKKTVCCVVPALGRVEFSETTIGLDYRGVLDFFGALSLLL